MFKVHHTPVTEDLPQRLGALLNYIQPRDPLSRGRGGARTLMTYAGAGDRAIPGGLFDGRGQAGPAERKQLLSFILRSAARMRPQINRARDGSLVDGSRALYHLMLSPEHSGDLNLRRLTREVMAQLDRDAAGIGPWIGAEHRNTAHPHVHVVLAAGREVEAGGYRRVMVNRRRWLRMREAMYRELDRQRGRAPLDPAGPRLTRWVGLDRVDPSWSASRTQQILEVARHAAASNNRIRAAERLTGKAFSLALAREAGWER